MCHTGVGVCETPNGTMLASINAGSDDEPRMRGMCEREGVKHQLLNETELEEAFKQLEAIRRDAEWSLRPDHICEPEKSVIMAGLDEIIIGLKSIQESDKSAEEKLRIVTRQVEVCASLLNKIKQALRERGLPPQD